MKPKAQPPTTVCNPTEHLFHLADCTPVVSASAYQQMGSLGYSPTLARTLLLFCQNCGQVRKIQ